MFGQWVTVGHVFDGLPTLAARDLPRVKVAAAHICFKRRYPVRSNDKLASRYRLGAVRAFVISKAKAETGPNAAFGTRA